MDTRSSGIYYDNEGERSLNFVTGHKILNNFCMCIVVTAELNSELHYVIVVIRMPV